MTVTREDLQTERNNALVLLAETAQLMQQITHEHQQAFLALEDIRETYNEAEDAIVQAVTELRRYIADPEDNRSLYYALEALERMLPPGYKQWRDPSETVAETNLNEGSTA